jgi:chromosome segregation ATPase
MVALNSVAARIESMKQKLLERGEEAAGLNDELNTSVGMVRATELARDRAVSGLEALRQALAAQDRGHGEEVERLHAEIAMAPAPAAKTSFSGWARDADFGAGLRQKGRVEVEAAKARLARAEGVVDRLKRLHEDTMRGGAELDSQLAGQQTELREWKRKKRRLEQAIDGVMRSGQEADARLNRQKESVQTRMSTLQQRLREQEGRCARIDEEIAIVQDDIRLRKGQIVHKGRP